MSHVRADMFYVEKDIYGYWWIVGPNATTYGSYNSLELATKVCGEMNMDDDGAGYA